ncbi:2-hydroxyglutaryl-CoA dehydratase, D-component [Peptococcaceae bacterium CEB3]|nr:2-hydroxyglutaryl-CoA dehydratase, D-component [Peptococcaceae bacterium CEB3]
MKVTFPHMGNLWVVVQSLFESLGMDVVVPPENSKRTLALGAKLSPESACLPLKLNLGNFIEAAERGADTIAITGGIGPCRFGYYGEIERQILHEAGYPYDVVILEPPDGSFWGLLQRIRYLVGRKVSWYKILNEFLFSYRKAVAVDQVEDVIHRARPRFANPIEAERLYQEAKIPLAGATMNTELKAAVTRLEEGVREKELQTGKDGIREPVRVGVVGEIYTLLDPFSSVDVEQQLGHLGVHVARSIYLSGWVAEHLFHGLIEGYRSMSPYRKLAEPYLPHLVGGHGRESIGASVQFAEQGFDGLIHLFPLTCMPEITAASILPRVQKNYGIPILRLVMDEHSGRAGVQTRLEAFVDLLERASALKQDEVRKKDISFRLTAK